MSKRDAPAMKLTVENGRLVPASAWDQERLLTYRNRSTVNAYITQDKPRKLERQYWAILDKVVTTCGVKQRTSEDLHDHIKLKLGFVNAKFDDNGKLKVTLKSTKLMEDPEYYGFFKEAMGFLFEMTGVDPMMLKKESADVGEDEQEPSSAAPSAQDVGRDVELPADVAAANSNASEGYCSSNGASDDSGGAGSTAAYGTAAPNSEGELDAGNGASAPDDSGSASASTSDAAATPSADAADQAASAGGGAVPALAAEHECIRKLMAIVADPALTPKEAAQTLAESADIWLGHFGPERKPFVTAVFQTCKQLARGEVKPDDARRYLEGLAA